jgi:hypothetical protein
MRCRLSEYDCRALFDDCDDVVINFRLGKTVGIQFIMQGFRVNAGVSGAKRGLAQAQVHAIFAPKGRDYLILLCISINTKLLENLKLWQMFGKTRTLNLRNALLPVKLSAW